MPLLKKKIIHLLCHSLPNDDRRDYYVFGNWASRLARSIEAQTKKYSNEVWYAMRGLKKSVVIKKNNITYKLFPAATIHPLIESFFPLVSSPLLFSEMKKENAQNVIVHMQGERGTLLHTLLSKFPQIQVVVQYHGYGQPRILNFLEKICITPFEKIHFPKVKHFFVHVKNRIDYLKNTLHIAPSRVSYHNVGVNFDLFKPGNKLSARKKLNLPPNAYIMFYIGSMVATKGVHKIMESYRLLKKKYPYLYLIFIGAHKGDPLYREAIETADRVLSLVPNDQVAAYYVASDVYCFYGNEKTQLYAGIGTAPTEALACNINVVSTNLIHLPDKVVPRAGLIPTNFNDFVKKIEYLIQHPKKQFAARNLVAPYTANNYMIRNVIKLYEHLTAKTK